MARIAGVNIPTNKRVIIALQYIHGIGPKFASEITEKVGIPAERRVNELTDAEVIQIREAIDRLVAGRTTFAIAHRFSTLKNADRLIVLEKGKVVEIGTHEELMAKEEGVFRRLCEMQSEMSRLVAVGG